ncbi:PREDICTED: zinc finger protein 512B-like [Vollenhovia emeryi]|uniref:zinc finger protein 512B-like n=1 Tax=Vollenhovia emeryi TaxID=411798 RepID=UPI0005F4D529|nr:PREDICTED: zinc finger protein 512B-like [Vollenhovia emeryi]
MNPQYPIRCPVHARISSRDVLWKMLHLPSVLALCLLIKTAFASFSGSDSGWQGLSNFGATHYDSSGQNLNIHQTLPSYGSYSSFGNGGDLHIDLDQEFKGSNVQHTIAEPVSISKHVEVTKPVAVPVVKNIGIPVAQTVTIPVPHPMAVGVAQPYPVHVPVVRPIPVPVVKTVAIPVEKKVPYPVEKIIPVPVEKPVPITIEKHVPVPVEKPYPIHIPVYKHIFHRRKIRKRRGRKRRY